MLPSEGPYLLIVLNTVLVTDRRILTILRVQGLTAARRRVRPRHGEKIPVESPRSGDVCVYS